MEQANGVGVVEKTPGSVVDLFCGAGGLSHGFFLEGFTIAAGIDIDERCRFPFEQNNKSNFICQDVSKLDGDEVNDLFAPDQPKVLVGCAPCQPFSSYGRKQDPTQWSLLEDFAQIVGDVEPDVVSMENVPRLRSFKDGEVLKRFMTALEEAGLGKPTVVTAYAPDYGVPQTRSRLVLLASRHGAISLTPPTHNPDSYATVASTVGDLAELADGAVDKDDPLHKSSRLSPVNRRRIRASKPGGTWEDWPDEIVAACHKKDGGRSWPSVYGRMKWDEPAPTITTQFYRYGTGRFGHPKQHRALSLREGALLQSFPRDYEFAPSDDPVEITPLGRLIGNAVPVLLAQAIAKSVRIHLDLRRGQ